MVKTFCITLPHRGDRREQTIAECNKVGLQPKWINAVNGKSSSIGPVNACKYSHWFCIKLAQHEQRTEFLVLEDDVVFSDDFSLDLKDVPDDWDIVYFGGNHSRGTPIHVKNNVYKCTYTLCAHAMLVRYTCYELLLNRLLETEEPVDVILGKLHATDVNAYVIYPHTAWQRAGFSDIERRQVDYSFLKDRPI